MQEYNKQEVHAWIGPRKKENYQIMKVHKDPLWQYVVKSHANIMPNPIYMSTNISTDHWFLFGPTCDSWEDE